jgi:hypothetical protein
VKSLTGLMLCALLALAACGKKGDPQPLTPDTFPNQYPKAEAVPELQGKPAPPPPAQQRQPTTSPLTPFQPFQ